jgi:hypothetical protein
MMKKRKKSFRKGNAFASIKNKAEREFLQIHSLASLSLSNVKFDKLVI